MIKLTEFSGKTVIVRITEIRMVHSHGDKSLVYVKDIHEPIKVKHRLEEIENLILIQNAILQPKDSF
ncbi:TPA: hypothetical protein ACS61N_004582 [Klebsiella oxytoca]